MHFSSWLRDRAPQILLAGVIAGIVAVFYPADVGSKVRAWLAVVATVALISLIPTGDRKKKLTSQQLLARLRGRAVRKFPPLEKIDPSRPLLAIASSEGVKSRVFMLLVQHPPSNASAFCIRPIDSRILRGDAVEVVDDVAALRRHLDERGLRFVPQSSFTDMAAIEFFGEGAHLQPF